MKLTKTSKTIIHKIWVAWATYARFCWDTVKDIPPQTRTYFELTEICEADRPCGVALGEWYALQQLAEELDINWMNYSHISEETAAAAKEHDFYEDLIHKHAAR